MLNDRPAIIWASSERSPPTTRIVLAFVSDDRAVARAICCDTRGPAISDGVFGKGSTEWLEEMAGITSAASGVPQRRELVSAFYGR